ncbi:MAG: hypothetical protein R2880_11145 [Deinococcales bacterium]
MMFNYGDSGSSSPTLTNVSFEGNSAYHGGAGCSMIVLLSALRAVPRSQCKLCDNSATYDGGAMYNNGNSGMSSPTLTNVL